jgi:DNA processing protein
MGLSRSDDEARSWLALALVPELTPRRIFALVERFGSPRAALGGLETSPAEEKVEREIATLAAAGSTFVAWSDAAYPVRLREIPDPPPVLAVRGQLEAGDEVAIAVVGTRRASEYGRRVATEIAGGLAAAGVTVVSGMAAGIDAAAHRAAIESGGRTIAVLGTGIDVVYPRWHAALADAIAQHGALVSEFPCGAPPLQFHFPRRNRLISGLTLGTVVVEAAEQSGSLITASFALEQGRQVCAVPGPARAVNQRGSHRLIQEGAKLVTCAEDVLAELLPAYRARLSARRAAAVEASLTAPERRILAVIADGRHVDQVIREVDVPPAAVLETLLALELRGLVRQLPGKRFCRHAA